MAFMAARASGAGASPASRFDRTAAQQLEQTPPAPDADVPLGDLLATFDARDNGYLQEMIAACLLAHERDEVCAEIAQGLLYDAEQIVRVSDALRQRGEDTIADNIRRICLAYAELEPAFARAHHLMELDEHRLAREEIERIIHPGDHSYFAAAKLYVYARCRRGEGDLVGAIECYGELLTEMPERTSFAAAAASEAGSTYDRCARPVYALHMYRFVLSHYGPILRMPLADTLSRRVEELEGQCDPAARADFEADASTDEFLLCPAEATHADPTPPQREGRRIASLLVELIADIEQRLREGPFLPPVLGAPHMEPADEAPDPQERPQPAPEEASDWGPGPWERLTPGQRRELIEIGRRRFHPFQHNAAREYAEQIDPREP